MKPDQGIFKQTPTRTESKNDATDKAAREIIMSEAAATAAKTAKLRAERLAREALQAAEPPAPKEKRTTARKVKTIIAK